MKRKLSLIEGTMYAGGKTAVNVTSTVRIKGHIDFAKLKNAVRKVQHKHPLLSVNVLEDELGIPYFVSQKTLKEISIRKVPRQTDEDWQTEAKNECLKPFDVRNEPLMRLVWLYTDRTSDLIFICHHCICDGRSVLNIIDETLSVLTEPLKEIGSYQSFQSADELIPAALNRKKLNGLKKFLVTNIARTALSVVSLKKEIKREKPFLIHWKLDKIQSSAVLERCKKENLSVNAAICVAFSQAYKVPGTIKTYDKLYCAVDMRKFLPSIATDMIFAYPAMIDLSLKKHAAADFREQTRKINDDLKAKMDKMDVSKILMFSECLLPLLPKMTKYAKAEAGVHDFTLSNMGRIDIREQYADLIIEAVYPHTTIFPFGNPSTLFSTSFKGEIDFIFTSDEAFIKKSDALLIKDKAMEFLSAI